MRLPRLRRPTASAEQVSDVAAEAAHEPQPIKIDTDQLCQLSAVFAAPRWLRDVGMASWLLVGLVLLLAGVVWLLALTAVIVEPVAVGLILATVTTPAVSWLQRKRLPRHSGR